MATRSDSDENNTISDQVKDNNNVSVTANPISSGSSASVHLPHSTTTQPTTEAATPFHAPSSSSPATTRRKRPCRYFGTKNGCRLGDRCPFLHDAANLVVVEKARRDPVSVMPPSTEVRRYMAGPVDQSLVVRKPVSSAQESDPREFQIRQLRRRFSPQESKHASGSSFVLRMVPSDPDFPFELDSLECVLEVPLDYPRTGKPWLKVTNKDIPRGYQINIENGFKELVERMPQATLLQSMNVLDKNLERFLAEEKKATIKLVSNVKAATSSASARQARAEPPRPYRPRNEVDEAQKLAAKAKRDRETSQLEARLGRLPLFSKDADGVTYIIPLEPRRSDELPVPLQGIRSAKLIVPMLYDLEPCRLEFQDVPRDAAGRAERVFERRAREHRDMSLMAHVNYLAQTLHVLATEEEKESKDERYQPPDITNLKVEEETPTTFHDPDQDPKGRQDLTDDRSHIKVIPRPPEWNVGNDDHSDEEEYSTSSSDAESEEEQPTAAADIAATPTMERGTSLSFPFIELHGIELLELTSLSIVVRCERCKQTKDVNNLKNNATTTQPADLRSESCNKCASPFSVGTFVQQKSLLRGSWEIDSVAGYRREFVHANSVRAGFVDLVGCQVVDMLPSRFIPTCAECSTAYPSPGMVSVRGESAIAFCRDCHHRMSAYKLFISCDHAEQLHPFSDYELGMMVYRF
ncbi:MAG: hypothetical protein M1816_004510 [Peltula sp. TS41687]|nr:MAG: hypothetical protein M1816_004510 [Peltula sp. TS41687]